MSHEAIFISIFTPIECIASAEHGLEHRRCGRIGQCTLPRASGRPEHLSWIWRRYGRVFSFRLAE